MIAPSIIFSTTNLIILTFTWCTNWLFVRNWITKYCLHNKERFPLSTAILRRYSTYHRIFQQTNSSFNPWLLKFMWRTLTCHGRGHTSQQKKWLEVDAPKKLAQETRVIIIYPIIYSIRTFQRTQNKNGINTEYDPECLFPWWECKTNDTG